MIEFPPEFYGMVTAFWSTYQYAIFIWMALMFAGVVILCIGLIVSNIVRVVWSL